MSDKENEPWYTSKTVFYYPKSELYEERVVLHKANSWDEAFDKSEKEAKSYVEEKKSIGSHVEIVENIEIFHVFGDRIGPDVELFSSLRKTEMSKDDYIRVVYREGLDWRNEE